MTKTKENKEVFKICMGVLGVEFRVCGYLPHPAYSPGWEASHQEYECNWLKEDVSRGIDEISMTWNPKDRLIRISRSLTHPQLPNDFGFSSITTNPFEFNYFLNNPYVRFTLIPVPRRFWHLRKADLKLRPKEITNPEEIKKSLERYVIPCLPKLLQAKDINAKDKSISIDYFDIVAKNG